MLLKFNSQYFDEGSREKMIKAITQNYDFVTLNSAAESYCGRSLDMLEIGNPNNVVLFAGALHGMEWLTSLLLLLFLQNLCQKIKNKQSYFGVNVKKAFEKRGLCIIPCVNPDGVEISTKGANFAGKYKEVVEVASCAQADRWQANARGVDLNHNFDAGWKDLKALERKNGIIGPARTQYGGESPFSEVETKALMRLCFKRDFKHALAFHSQGEEIYWAYGKNTPKESKEMGKIFAKSSGYKLCSPQGLAVGGGFKDWFIEKLKKPAFTIEIGKGVNPLPLADIEEIYTRLEKMLLLAALI